MSTLERPEAGLRRAKPAVIDEVFASDVLAGLSKPQKELPCRWFYDTRGSELFEAITGLPEYYPTKTEAKILTACALELSGLAGPRVAMIEYGAGAAVKTRLLLDALEAPLYYAPVDISAAFLRGVAENLAREYPAIAMRPIIGNFLSDLEIPTELQTAQRRLGFFPGSTIGNLSDDEITAFFRRARRQLGEDGMLVIGADLRKSPDILIPAYDDSAGVTAAFNKNLLARINRELGGDFDLERFSHKAVWNDADSRIEMHLVSDIAQSITLLGKSFDFAGGESIHTENSRKFSVPGLQSLAEDCGWRPVRVWEDPQKLFSVQMFG
ncbi:L-histidine N(alpha)-methyltransferase [Denitrobaculum tricleocarpae]|uniref:L-histidine N(Alpha)-methyltransferase n=1 Tax=Denitrobaculum tricleocarpae TaxID=2591009 RepID=A0A545T433_9PROT|nr:L-histidine N(alpha)-methyltransferase [Denitrobaculum tricleocarpae]TQV71918.1 L-histidine N(alpha)-methyltransferase [Denitrobaculum tricleocarpae]